MPGRNKTGEEALRACPHDFLPFSLNPLITSYFVRQVGIARIPTYSPRCYVEGIKEWVNQRQI